MKSEKSKIPLPLLVGNPRCVACDLHATCKSVCIPTRPWVEPRGVSIALLAIGEAPGAEEDKACSNFVGQAGGTLDRWLRNMGLAGTVDVYLCNTVRCRPPGNADPTAPQVKACRQYLEHDLQYLHDSYPCLVLLTLGGPATANVRGTTLTQSFRLQGEPVTVGGVTCPCYSTYHPAYTLPHRSPQAMHAVADHLDLLCRKLCDYSEDQTNSWPSDCVGSTLVDGSQTNSAGSRQLRAPVRSPRKGELPVAPASELKPPGRVSGSVVLPSGASTGSGRYEVRLAPLPPSYRVPCLAVDIETYGLEKGTPQTQFHPLKSIAHDGVARDKLILTVGCAWRAPDGSLQTACYNYQDRDHRQLLDSLMAWSDCLLFKNGPFDLSYLLVDGRMVWLCSQAHTLLTEDVDVWNYLFSDVRPEKSLKSLGPLLGLPSYGGDGKFKTFESAVCDEALFYVTKDACETLECREILQRQITDTFGPDSVKLSDWTRKWYSDLIWTCVYMSLDGIPMDRAKMAQLKRARQVECEALALQSKLHHDIIIRGKGSQSSISNLVTVAALEADLMGSEDLELTDKGGLPSSKLSNLNLIQAHLSETSKYDKPLDMLIRYRRISKLLDTYICPMIGPYGDPHKKGYKSRSVLPSPRGDVAFIYPIWNPVPSGRSRNEDEGGGGTKQGRITARDPSPQVFSSGRRVGQDNLKACMVPYYDPGYFLTWDLKQIELCQAAFHSQDPVLLSGIEGDLHRDMALEIYGADTLLLKYDSFDSKDFKDSLERYVGKTTNFNIIYLGGWVALRQFLREEEVIVSKDFAQDVIQKARQRYRAHVEWVMGQVQEVNKHGYLLEPIIGQGRWFTWSPKTNKVHKNEIANLKIQASSANLLLSAQMPLTFWLRQHPTLESRCVFNGYDSLGVHGPLSELDEVTEVAYHYVETSEYRKRLEDYYGRSALVRADKTVVIRGDK